MKALRVLFRDRTPLGIRLISIAGWCLFFTMGVDALFGMFIDERQCGSPALMLKLTLIAAIVPALAMRWSERATIIE